MSVPLTQTSLSLSKERIVVDLTELVLELEHDFGELSPATNFFTFTPSNTTLAMEQLLRISLPDKDGEHSTYHRYFVDWLIHQGVSKIRSEELVQHYVTRIWSIISINLGPSETIHMEQLLAHYTIESYRFNVAVLRRATNLHTDELVKWNPQGI